MLLNVGTEKPRRSSPARSRRWLGGIVGDRLRRAASRHAARAASSRIALAATRSRAATWPTRLRRARSSSRTTCCTSRPSRSCCSPRSSGPSCSPAGRDAVIGANPALRRPARLGRALLDRHRRRPPAAQRDPDLPLDRADDERGEPGAPRLRRRPRERARARSSSSSSSRSPRPRRPWAWRSSSPSSATRRRST